MISKPAYGRRLGLLGASLTKARLNPHTIKALGFVRDELELLLDNADYLKEAPFSWVTLSLRFGLKNDDKPSYERINIKYGDLPLAIELDVHELVDVSIDELKTRFKVAVLKALIHAGRKYNCPVCELEREFAKTIKYGASS